MSADAVSPGVNRNIHVSDKVRDNNKVAMALMKSKHASKMYLMSDRVQKKYGVNK